MTWADEHDRERARRMVDRESWGTIPVEAMQPQEMAASAQHGAFLQPPATQQASAAQPQKLNGGTASWFTHASASGARHHFLTQLHPAAASF